MARRRWAMAWVGVLVLAPYLARLGWPSLFGDDVVRIAQIRNEPWVEVLRRPFNEHLAPGHGLLTWMAWEMSGRRLTSAPWTFTLSAWLSYPLVLGVLGGAVWRRSGELDLALAAVAVAGLSWLPIETMAYHSGSGFLWALAATLAAWGWAGPSRRASWAAFGCAAVAPAFSAMGLLAGPMGLIGGWWGFDVDRHDPSAVRRRGRAAAWPLAGTVVYLVVAMSARYGATLARGLERRVDLVVAVQAAGRAVSNVLPLAVVGGRPAWSRPLGWSDAVWGAAVAVGMVAAGWRTRQRAWALAGLVLIGGGYGLTYPFRYEGSSEWLLRVDRYHLFPHFGLVIWLGMLGRLALRSWPRLRVAGLGPVVALMLVVVNGRGIVERLKAYAFGEQGRVLAALEELEAVCRAEGITRAQALAALEPIRTSWLHPERHGTTVLAMLGPTVEASRVEDDGVRGRLVACLSPQAREALWGGMDVTRSIEPDRPGAEVVTSAVAVGTEGVRPMGDGWYRSRGGSAFVEYAMGPGEGAARGLRLGVRLPDGPKVKLPPIEVWWSGVDGSWSETRRVTWRPAAGEASGVVPLEVMPHWGDWAGPRRLRVAVRVAGTVAIDPPRLVR